MGVLVERTPVSMVVSYYQIVLPTRHQEAAAAADDRLGEEVVRHRLEAAAGQPRSTEQSGH